MVSTRPRRLFPHATQVLELLQSRLHDVAQWLAARQRWWVERHAAIDADLDMGVEEAAPPPLYDDALWEGADVENDDGAAAPEYEGAGEERGGDGNGDGDGDGEPPPDYGECGDHDVVPSPSKSLGLGGEEGLGAGTHRSVPVAHTRRGMHVHGCMQSTGVLLWLTTSHLPLPPALRPPVHHSFAPPIPPPLSPHCNATSPRPRA